jgi:hypothetical protein
MPSDVVVISIAGILTSGVLGPAAAARWARNRQSREFEHDRRTRRTDDLRLVLDNAAVSLGSGISRFRSAFEAEAAGAPVPASMAEWAERAHLADERLRLRLPTTHPVVITYEAARERLVEFAEMLDETQGKDPDRAEDARSAFESARGAFLGEAQALLERGDGY